MIAESERGFNYTLTRDKLAMNLGSPPRKLKNAAMPPPKRETTTTPTPPTTNIITTTTSLTPTPYLAATTTTRDTRIETLEAQLASLTQKGVEAADRLADYEEEIRQLKTAANPRTDSPLGIIAPAAAPPPVHALPPLPAAPTAPPAPLSRQSSTASLTSRTFSFLTRTSSLTNTTKPLPKTPPKQSPMAPSQNQQANSAAITELQTSLATETRLRLAAEKKLEDLNGELEDLSATLFEQANEMVATERREKAKLQERIKTLEGRGVEGQRRLEMVESALERLERVKKLLDE